MDPMTLTAMVQGTGEIAKAIGGGTSSASGKTGDILTGPVNVGGLNMAPTMSISLPFLALAVIVGIYLIKR